MTSRSHNGTQVYLEFASYPYDDIKEAWTHIQDAIKNIEGSGLTSGH
jgi:hypothetical protein